MNASERAFNLARAFNIHEGFAREDDTLPQRLFEGLEFGARKRQRIDKAEFDKAVKPFHEMAGWDEEGKPTPGKLYELGLDYGVEELYKG